MESLTNFVYKFFGIYKIVKNEEIFKQVIEEAKEDPNIIGLFLSGSRGKNLQKRYSDYDVIIIVKDGMTEFYKKKYENREITNFDFSIFSISSFRRYAEIGSPTEWDRASFTHVNAIVDKTGEIQKLINEKGRIPKDKIEKYVSGYLDGYINAVYRSLKCFRDGNVFCARLEAAKSIEYFLKIIFGIGGRVVPFPKYLEWELENYPLKKFQMKPQELISNLLEILNSGNIKIQQKLFGIVEKVFKNEGYGWVFDSWNSSSIEFIKTFGSKS